MLLQQSCHSGAQLRTFARATTSNRRQRCARVLIAARAAAPPRIAAPGKGKEVFAALHRRVITLRDRPHASSGSAPLAAAAGLPDAAEDKSVAHSAFLQAYRSTQNPRARIPGLQEFFSGVWERRKHIPSSSYSDPLDRLFTEFDQDKDGHLTAAEVASALHSRGVQITESIAQQYIDTADANANHRVEREEFASLVYRMALADLTGKAPEPRAGLRRTRSLLEPGVLRYVLSRDPSIVSIKGLQAFAASIWDRRRRVPQHVWQDPLEATFAEFDKNGDGHMTAQELVEALRSRDVAMTLDQARLVMDAVDADGNGTIERDEFPSLIYGLATLDRWAAEAEAAAAADNE